MPANALGTMLRHWRGVRGKSQLALALDAGLSQRHLSFVESGRSVPGRETLLKLAATLDVPLRGRNSLLLAAGYAPAYADDAWDAAGMADIGRALRRTLRQHEPFPALVLDRHWNVLLSNDGAKRLFGSFVDLASRPSPRNLLHLLFDPAGLRPFVADWPEVARSLFERVHREAVGRVADEETRALLAALAAYPEVRTEWQHAGTAADARPVIPIGFLREGRVLRYFSLVATVGTPQAVAAQELRLECMFPADEESESRHLALVGAAAP